MYIGSLNSRRLKEKNSPQALSCTFGQDNLQKTPPPLVGYVLVLGPRGGQCGIRVMSVTRFPTNPCFAAQLPLGELTQLAQYLVSSPSLVIVYAVFLCSLSLTLRPGSCQCQCGRPAACVSPGPCPSRQRSAFVRRLRLIHQLRPLHSR